LKYNNFRVILFCLISNFCLFGQISAETEVEKCRKKKNAIKCNCIIPVLEDTEAVDANEKAHAYYYSVLDACVELSDLEKNAYMLKAIKHWDSFTYTGHRKHYAYSYLMNHFFHNDFSLDSLKYFYEMAIKAETHNNFNAEYNFLECLKFMARAHGFIGDYYSQLTLFKSFLAEDKYRNIADSVKVIAQYYIAEGTLDFPSDSNVEFARECIEDANILLHNGAFKDKSSQKFYSSLLNYNLGRSYEREGRFKQALDIFEAEKNYMHEIKQFRYEAIFSAAEAEMAFFLKDYVRSMDAADYSINLFELDHLKSSEIRSLPFLWLAKAQFKLGKLQSAQNTIYQGLNISFDTDTINAENLLILDIKESKNIEYSNKLLLELAAIKFDLANKNKDTSSLLLAKQYYNQIFHHFHTYIDQQDNVNSRYLNKELQIQLFESLVEVGLTLDNSEELFDIIDRNKMSILNYNEDYKKYNLEKVIPDCSIIQYSFTSDSLIAVVYENGVYSTYKLTNKNEINSLIKKFMSELNSKSNKVYETSFYLYENLIKPLNISHSKIVVIPDNELFYIPFGALRFDQNDRFSFLEKKYTIHYQYSIQSLIEKLHAKRNASVNTTLFIPEFLEDPNVSYTNTRSVGLDSEIFHLPYAKSEGNFIKEEFSAEYAEVNKETLIHSIQESGIIHFAGHAINIPDNPDFSFLALHSNIEDRKNTLMLKELLNVNCQNDMIVLSACETGTGKISKGEGSLSLARGFFFAGARAIISTLWSVNDKSSYSIMKDFYINLKSNQEKDSALRNAKLSYLNRMKDPQYKHPYYWAGFIAVGNMSGFEYRNSEYSLYFYGGILLFLLSGFYIARITLFKSGN